MIAPLRACLSSSPYRSVAQGPLLQACYSLPAHGFHKDLLGALGADPLPSPLGNNSQPPQAGVDGYSSPNPPQKQLLDPFLPSRKLRLHCHSSPNNTIATLTQADGSTIAWFSGGSCGFKKGNRATYEAGYQCAVRMFRKIEDEAKSGPVYVDLLLKGFGQGREALKGALLAAEGERIRPLISSITDRTPLKIGGTRSKKMARL